MIAEDVLERGLAAAAGDYDVSPGAVEQLRELIAPRSAGADGGGAGPGRFAGFRQWRPSGRQWLAVAAAAVVALVAVPIAIGGSSSTNHPEPLGAASPITPSMGDGGSGSDRAGPAPHGGAESGPDSVATAPLASAQVAPVPAPRKGAATGGLAGGTATNGPRYGAYGHSAGSSAPDRLEPPIAAAPERIVKTGELDLQVDKGKVSTTLDRLTALATVERGYVADSRTEEAGPEPSGAVTLRVPVDRFEDTVSRARTYGAKVLSLQTTAHDVTSQYVDLSARIRALQKTRSTFLTLLSKASTIGETLAVQQRVDDAQTQIERLQGQRKVLANRSALSTLTVTVDQKTVAMATTTHEKSGLAEAVDRSVSRFVHGIEAIIAAIGPVLLVLLVLAIGWLVARVGYRLLRRRLV